MTEREALNMALQALETLMIERGSIYDKAITAIKEALAQPEQEPVAWMNDMGTHIDLNVSGRGTPLYTTSPQRKPLTDEEVRAVIRAGEYDSMEEFARAIEAAHGIKGEA